MFVTEPDKSGAKCRPETWEESDELCVFIVYFVAPENNNLNNASDLIQAGGKETQFQVVYLSTEFDLLKFDDILYINSTIMKAQMSVEMYKQQVSKGENMESVIEDVNAPVTVFTVDLEVNKWRRLEHHCRETNW